MAESDPVFVYMYMHMYIYNVQCTLHVHVYPIHVCCVCCKDYIAMFSCNYSVQKENTHTIVLYSSIVYVHAIQYGVVKGDVGILLVIPL